MATQKIFIEPELDWLEQRLQEIKEDIDSKPYTEIKDRTITLFGVQGNSEKVVATEEAQKKAQREALKEYTALLADVDKLRERQEAKIQARGKAEISSLAKNFLQGKVK